MRRKRSPAHSASGQPRRSRRIHEEASGGHAEGTRCSGCQSSYREGRWTWKKAPVDFPERLCPACERIEQGYPAGIVHVEGAFASEHRDELIGLVRNVEQRERTEHPLKRVMAIENLETGFTVTTTDEKLAQSLGRALQKAYDGRLEHPGTTSDTGNLVRVRWIRD